MMKTKRFFVKLILCASVCAASACSSAETVKEAAEKILMSRPEEILEGMSLQEKAEQMLMPSFRYSEYTDSEQNVPLTEMTDEIRQAISTHNFGGVILFGQNLQGTIQTVQLVQDIMTANAAGDNVPLLIAADQEGGTVRRIMFGTFGCGNMALAAAGDRQESEQAAALIAEELQVLGINTNFAPVTDVNVNPANPVIGVRSFSDDPDVVSEFAKAYIKGMHDKNIVTALKHFPGHGDTDVDSHTGLPQVNLSYEELKETHLKPYFDLHKDADIIMSAHIEFPQIDDTVYTDADGNEICLPATMSKKILTGILREEIGYEGVICTDAMTMDAIRAYWPQEDAAVNAINAGADLILIPVYEEQPVAEYIGSLDSLVQRIVSGAESGEISIDRINESVLRILSLKEKRGILDTVPWESAEEQAALAKETVGSKDHHDREFAVSEKAVTLLKNENNVLPLGRDTDALVLVPFDNRIMSVTFAEEYLRSRELLDQGSLSALSYGSTYIEDIITVMNEQQPDVLVIVTSVFSSSDMSDHALLLPVMQEAEASDIPIVILSAQLPYDLSLYDNADVHMACYLASGISVMPVYDGRDNPGYGPNLPAALAVMYNDKKPQGRLPVDIPVVSEEDGYLFGDELYYRRGDGIGY